MKPVLYAVRALPGGHLERLSDRFELRGHAPRPAPRERMLAEAREAEVLVPTYLDCVDDALLAELPRVRLVASYGVGTNHIELEACRRRGVPVTNTPDVLTDATADMAMALLLAAARRVCEADRWIRAGRWSEVDPANMLGTEVTGKTLGIVGFGRIGRAVAARAAGFRMRVLYAGPREADAAGARRVSLDELLAESDFVSLHCPLDASTRNLLSRERLARMKPGAILVNTARGQVVDLDALSDALASGRLAAAGIDVFPDEPRVPEALVRLENVVLTPHIGSGTRETRSAMARIVAEEIARLASGEPLRHRVV